MKMQSPWLVLACVAAAAAAAAAHGATDVKKVHIVFMNHLDVGYDGIPQTGFINNILNDYFHQYFTQAAQLGHDLMKGGYLETFKYTTHPWLVSMFLDCPPNLYLAGVKLKCPNATEVIKFRDAVAAGYITWHAGPMNMQPENMDEPLWQFGLRLGQDLDRQCGISRKARVLSQRDVPGLTQGTIPSMVKMGVIGVSVGVNSGTAPPAVPRIFRWAYENYEVLGTWHPGGYPDNPGLNPANPGGISKDDCVTIDNFSEALCFAFRTDNSGPPLSVQEVLSYYEILRKEFPGADLQASTLEDFMLAVQPIKDKLPLVREEIGDTWILGAGSDPRKAAEYRAMSTVLGECVKSGRCDYNDSRVYNSSRLLLKLPEHTFGLPSVGDTIHWSNHQLASVIDTPGFVNCTKAWLEQRNFTYIALEALRDHPVVEDVKRALSALKPAYPDLQGYVQVSDMSRTFTCGDITLGFSMSGAIDNLIYNKTKWAAQDSLLGQFMYVSYSEEDFTKFGEVYNYNGGSAGFQKYNSTLNAHEEHRNWPVTMRELYINTGKCRFYAHLQLVERRGPEWYGAPQDIWLQYLPTSGASPGVEVILQLFDKTATRLPEALYLSFKPLPQAGHSWKMSKTGHMVDPGNVVLNGSQYQHIIDSGGVQYSTYPKVPAKGMQILSLDVPVVCPFTPNQMATIFPAPLQPIKSQITGMAYSLYNNIWDTNYIFWYPYIKEDRDFKARFRINFI